MTSLGSPYPLPVALLRQAPKTGDQQAFTDHDT
jgi:hypothetical protein